MSGLRAALWTGVAACLAFSLLPFLWFATTSLARPVEILQTPPTPYVSGTLEIYRSVLSRPDLARSFANSLIVASATTVLALAVASIAGYALARLRIPGRRWLLGAVLAAAMSPQIATVGPVWRLLQGMGLLNSLPGLVLPYVALSLPLAIWLLATFFRELPREIEEAALVDGCSRLTALWYVLAPLAAPGLFTTAILVFIFAWNEFFFALLILSDPAKHTLPIAIALFPGQYTVPWGEIAAASVVSTAPLIALVLLFQRRIVTGLLAGAVKG